MWHNGNKKHCFEDYIDNSALINISDNINFFSNLYIRILIKQTSIFKQVVV